MELLEKYYNERFKNKYDADFTDLSDEYKISLSKTTGFAFYKTNLAWKDLFKSIRNIFMK